MTFDPEWVEALNSFLDDNRLLTMPNGERIQFGTNVNFIFGTSNLRFASPATINRLSVEDVDVKPMIASWIAQPPECQGSLAAVNLPLKPQLLACTKHPGTHCAWAEEGHWKRRGVRYCKD